MNFKPNPEFIKKTPLQARARWAKEEGIKTALEVMGWIPPEKAEQLQKRVKNLERTLEHIGQVAGLCTYNYTGRVCKYCLCNKKEKTDD